VSSLQINRYIIGAVIGVAWSLTQLYWGIFGIPPPMIIRPLHLMFFLALVFAIRPLSKKLDRRVVIAVDAFLILFSFTIGLYLWFSYDRIVQRITGLDPILTFDYIFGIATIFLVIEAGRRTLGNIFAAILVLVFIYGFIGPYMPGFLYHRGVSLDELIEFQFLSRLGIFSDALGVSANYIFLFMLFSAFIVATGMSDFFRDLSLSLTGKMTGGPAKVSVISSGLVGMISGSGSANVAITGSYTIPMMKEIGYKPEEAGAVEAVASTGGGLMPPVMSAVAFIMAEFTGKSYWFICQTAVIPAILYYAYLYMCVHFLSKKRGIKALPKEDLPKFRQVLPRAYLLIPLGVLVYLLSSGYTEIFSVILALGACVAVSFFRKDTMLTPRKLLKAFVDGSRDATIVAGACAGAGLIVGYLIPTGVVMRLSGYLMAIAGENLFLALLIVAIFTMILGMGMNPSPAYIIVSALTIPILLRMGVELMAAHFFAFFFALAALYTPPVAPAAYVAAAIAKSSVLKTGLKAVSYGVMLFILPFLFVYQPALLGQGPLPIILLSFAMTFFAGFLLALAIIGYYKKELPIWIRILALASAAVVIVLVHLL
jgi:TRAP transporter 4TM/12TM fusion protein